MMYKPSQFNITRTIESGHTYLINTRTTAVLDVSSSSLEGLKTALMRCDDSLVESYDKKIIELLLDNGFIVPSEFDELDWMEKVHWKARNGKDALALAIVLTLACNFRCTYCYEDHININIDDDVCDQIITYLSKELNGKHHLNIAWFGGEPLLGIRRIEALTKRIQKLTKKFGVNYSSRISTNGYLLTPHNAKILSDCQVTDVQITLDGPPNVHNNRRFLKNGNPTFTKIYDNICSAIGMFSRLTIRVNIDKRNIDSIPKLLEDYLYPIHDDIYLSFAAAMSPNCVDNIENWTIPPDQFWKAEKKIGLLADKLGFKVIRGYPIPCTSFCNAYQKNSLIIDPYGLVNRCTKYLGRKKESYGYLDSDGTLKINQNSQQAYWDQWSPFIDNECTNCKALPLCMGGCLLYLASNKPKELTHRCFAKEDILNSLLRETIFKQLVDSGKIIR